MRWVDHHVVYQQHVRRVGGDLGDPRNFMRIESDAHERHHNRSRVLQLEALPDAAFEFARELLGSAAYDYLRRRYGGRDDRLDALLNDHESHPCDP